LTRNIRKASVGGVAAALQSSNEQQQLTILGAAALAMILPAVVVLGMWFLLQLHQLFAPTGTGGAVAYLTHVAGFAAGVIITLVLGFRPQRPRQRRA
jgi:membrane associated rhomboid family serine protease